MAKITNEREAHMHNVTEYMYAHAQDYHQDQEDMYLLGYLYGKTLHERNGERLLERNGFRLGLSLAVMNHGDSLKKAIYFHRSPSFLFMSLGIPRLKSWEEVKTLIFIIFRVNPDYLINPVQVYHNHIPVPGN